MFDRLRNALSASAYCNLVQNVRETLSRRLAKAPQDRSDGDLARPDDMEELHPISILEEECFDFPDHVIEMPEASPKDPAYVACALLLERAAASVGASLERVCEDGIVCVVLAPKSGWAETAQEFWGACARNGNADVNRSGNGRLYRSRKWLAWTASKSQTHADFEASLEDFSRAVMSGTHCVGFSSNPAWLLTELIQSADHSLTMDVLTATDVTAVATELCGGEPGSVLPDELAGLSTPCLLRLARRPGQSADDYLIRLRGLLEASVPNNSSLQKSESPRVLPTLDRLHGLDEAVAWGRTLARDLQAFRRGSLEWKDVDKGCLLSGPPGCGKTLFARALAATCDVPIVSGSYAEWHRSGSSHQGDLLKAMGRSFAEAREKAPCILFLDECDSFPNRSTIKHDWAGWEIQVVNGLLAEIDGVHGLDGVIMLGACNHPELLDPALIRSGRLDKHIQVQLPGRTALGRILREHLGDDLGSEDLGVMALAIEGYSGADCERFVRGARRTAREAGRAMRLTDLLDEVGGGDGRSALERSIVAIHEAAHALAICKLGTGDVQSVNINRSGGKGGGVVFGRSTMTMTADIVRRDLICLLAGRAGEEVVFGAPTAGSGGTVESDLAIATGLAATAVACQGLDETVGPIWLGMPDHTNLSEMLSTNASVATRVKCMLEEAYRDAVDLVRQDEDALRRLARCLLERHILNGTEVREVISGHSDEVLAA